MSDQPSADFSWQKRQLSGYTDREIRQALRERELATPSTAMGLVLKRLAIEKLSNELARRQRAAEVIKLHNAPG